METAHPQQPADPHLWKNSCLILTQLYYVKLRLMNLSIGRNQ